jgi:hypothetical protein
MAELVDAADHPIGNKEHVMNLQVSKEKRRAFVEELKAFDLPVSGKETDAYLSLEASIVEHGCINPIVMHGAEVISGRARKAICDEHGIKYETVQVDDLSNADLVSLRNDLNFAGRQIDMATKKEYAKYLLLASKGELSNRAVQSKASLDKKLVQAIRRELEASGDIPHTTIRYSRDGRSQDVSDKEERQSEANLDESQEDERLKEIDENPEDEWSGEVELEESHEDEPSKDEEEHPHLVCFDGPSPEELPRHVYQANSDKITIVRRKVDREEGDKYVLANGQWISKCYTHPTWVEAHDSLLAAVQSDQEEKAEDLEELKEKRKDVLSTLKRLESQIATVEKQKQKLELRLKKVEAMTPPKQATAEMEPAVAS